MYNWTTVEARPTGGNTGGWLQVGFPAVDPMSPTGWYDIIYTRATNLYAGTWNTNMWVSMDFWASNQSPGALQVRWGTNSQSPDMWGYELTPPTTGWTSLAASFLNWTNWQYPGGTEAQYLSDLAAIDWIGVFIYRGDENAQFYGLDDFDLEIPEPAECLLLAFALVTTGVSLRRKRSARKARPPPWRSG